MIELKEIQRRGATTPAVDPSREAAAARALLPFLQPGMRVLEMGCGAGWSSLLLASRLGSVYAFDSCQEARQLGAQYALEAGMEERVCFLDGIEGLYAGSFDLVYLSHRCDLIELARAASHLHAKGWLAVNLAAERLAEGITALQRCGFVPLSASDMQPIVLAEDLAPGARDTLLLAQRVTQRVGLKVRSYASQDEFLAALGLSEAGRLLETDLDTVDNDCERHQRKRRDAEVLCGLARSRPGPCLDLGTSHGRSAFKLASNIGEHLVTSVNMLPEQAIAAGLHTTHVLSREQIGSYARERGVRNMRQLYANTLQWDWQGVPDELQLAFVDACHDQAAVRSDSQQCWQRLRPGGFLVWHDFSPALASVHPWIETSMAGVRAFVEETQITSPIHHLVGSWCGVLQKDAP
ncbi:MAG: hypothetical protein CSA62_09125 [Planctomycetota bacterium]|nr:MAG: hypothetical protein CSA62_09125 [Planctomycetota bacterium]